MTTQPISCLRCNDGLTPLYCLNCAEAISSVVKEQTDLLLACRVILAELVEAEPSPVHTSREQAILRRIEQVLERTKT